MEGQLDIEAARGETESSYAAIVWQQFRKNRWALFGLWCVAVLFLLAIYAPLLCMNLPYFVYAKGQWSFPLFTSLFNRLLWQNAVDIFFNLLMVLSPIYLLVLLMARRRRLYLATRLPILHVLLFALFIPATFAGRKNPLYQLRPLVNYEQRIEAMKNEGIKHAYGFPPVPYHYRSTDPQRSVAPPSREHLLGADKQGRDVFARMLYGIRISLTIGVIAVSIYVAIGVVLGALSGYFGGWIDILVSRLVEVMLCIPSFFLILALAAVIEQRSIFHVMVIIGITGWTGVARLVRAEFLKLKNLEYSQAALALGLPRSRVIFRHILPNALAPVLVSATFGVAGAILIESSLAFLSLGDITAPSWGETLNQGRLEQKLWLILCPGLAIFFVVSVFNMVGEGLRDALDPRLRK